MAVNIIWILAGLLTGVMVYTWGRHDGSAKALEETAKLTEQLDVLHKALREALDKVPDDRKAYVPDPSGWRAKFFGLKREPLFEVTEENARTLLKEGHKVFCHPFDPIEIDYFDNNGFQAWAKDGYRIEGVRFYSDIPDSFFFQGHTAQVYPPPQ